MINCSICGRTNSLLWIDHIFVLFCIVCQNCTVANRWFIRSHCLETCCIICFLWLNLCCTYNAHVHKYIYCIGHFLSLHWDAILLFSHLLLSSTSTSFVTNTHTVDSPDNFPCGVHGEQYSMGYMLTLPRSGLVELRYVHHSLCHWTDQIPSFEYYYWQH